MPSAHRDPFRAWSSLVAPILALAFACAAPTAGDVPGAGDETAIEGHGDLVVGLGGKADEGGCDPTSDLCWPTVDAEAMRDYLAASDALVLSVGDASEDARRLTSAVDALSHKLDADERAALAELRARATALTSDAPGEARQELAALAHAVAGAHLVSGYTTANAVPLGARAEAERDGADAADDASAHLPAGPLPDGRLTDGMRESLEALRAAGVVGATYAFVLEHFGVLERRYEPLDEAFPFSEPREDRVARIVSHHVWASAGASVVANAEALIPYAGIVISISHNALMQMRLRARMVFEIAETYGIDIREDDNLLVATLVLMGAYGMRDVERLVVASATLPILIAVLERTAGAVTVRATLRALLRDTLRRVLVSVAEESARALARASATAAARGVGRQVLGYATFGLALVADVALTTVTTARIGRHAAQAFRPWGSGMLTEGAPELADRDRRDCATGVMAAAAFADGRLDASERTLLAAHLDRTIFVGGRFVAMNDDGALDREVALVGAARDVGSRVDGGLDRCLGSTYVGEDDAMRLALVSWVRTMISVDGSISRAEDAYAEALEVRLAGAGLFDGAAIEDDTFGDVRARIEALLLPGDDGTRLATSDVIAELDAPHARADAALAAAGL